MFSDFRDRMFGRHRRLAARLGAHGGELPADRLGGTQQAIDEIIATLAGAEWDALKLTGDRSARPIRVHWVENWDVNAVAFGVGGATPHVALYGGTATLLTASALAVARSAELWPDLPGGEPAAASYGPLSECFARRWPESRHAAAPSAERLYRPPETADRRTFASDLIWTSASFLFFHEAAHHRLGHVRRAARTFGAAEILEADVAAPPTGDPSTRTFRAMEIDADASAVRLTLAALAEARRGHPGDADGLPPAQALRMLLLSAGMLFNGFDYEQRGLAAFRDRRHPHPAVRLAAAVAEAAAWADRRDLSSDEVGDHISAGVRDLQRVSDALGWTLTQVMRDDATAVAAEAETLRSAAVESDRE